MRLNLIKGNESIRCKKCADGTLADYFVYLDAAKKEIPLCRQCATDICAIYDLKILQEVYKGNIV